MNRRVHYMLGAVIVLAAGLVGFARNRDEPGEGERRVKESAVPPRALATLKKLARGEKIRQFEEETENGQTYYEGSWKTTGGKVDVLVTAAGDLVEVEETVPQSEVPKPVLEQVRRTAGPGTKLHFEKKTLTLYEVHYQQGGRQHEVLFSPDGRIQKEGEDSADEEDDASEDEND